MSTEPMITIKDADGTMRQVPLSQLSKAANAMPASDTTVPANTEVPTVDTSPEDDIAELASLAAQQVAHESEAVTDTDTAAETSSDAPVADMLAPSIVASNMVPSGASSVEATATDIPDSVGMNAISEPIVAPVRESIPRKKLQSSPLPIAQTNTDASSVAPTSDELMVLPTPGPLTTTVPNTRVFESSPSAWDDTDHTSLLDETLTDVDTVVPQSINRPGTVAALATKVTPVAAPVATESVGRNTASMSSKKVNTQQFHEAFAAIAPTVDRPYTPGLKKVPMQDIVASASVPVTRLQPLGPVAELGSMTLDDYRRLGGRGQLGIVQLREKFELLLKESVTMYMQGVAAWHQSPVYRAYLGIIESSITANMSIDELFSSTAYDGASITASEWQALVGLHADIRL